MEQFKQVKEVYTFNDPEKLPTQQEREQWQNANRAFWETHSMRYDWRDKIQHEEGTKEFYQEIDKRFFEAASLIMPIKVKPFDFFIDFEKIKNYDVLEIGTGNGSHAQLIAPDAKSYTGIDITSYASENTQRRLNLFGLKGKVYQMDAEEMTFPDASFDFIWTWGVIHHSANTESIIKQIHRVLKPNGRAVVMVYYRSWWSYYFFGLIIGIFKKEFFKGKNVHQIIQSSTDGAIARYYTFSSWKKMVAPLFQIEKLYTLGNKPDILPLPAGGIKAMLLNWVPKSLTIFCLRNLKMGSFLIAEIVKK